MLIIIFWSEWLALLQRPPAPKTGVLLTELHPDILQKIIDKIYILAYNINCDIIRMDKYLRSINQGKAWVSHAFIYIIVFIISINPLLLSKTKD